MVTFLKTSLLKKISNNNNNEKGSFKEVLLYSENNKNEKKNICRKAHFVIHEFTSFTSQTVIYWKWILSIFLDWNHHWNYWIYQAIILPNCRHIYFKNLTFYEPLFLGKITLIHFPKVRKIILLFQWKIYYF